MKRVNHRKKKSKKHLLESQLTKAIHLEPIIGFITYKLSKIIPVCNEQQLKEFFDGLNNIQQIKVKTRAVPEIPTEITVYDSPTFTPIKELNRNWLLTHIDIGSKIKNFWITKNQDLAVEIIRQYPEIISDDGTQIYLSLFISMSPKEYTNFMVRVGLFKIMNKEDKKDRGYPEGTTIYTEKEFYNPIIARVILWSALTQIGTPEEQKGARKYLKKAGLECFIHTSRGRKRIVLKLRKDSNRLDSPFEQYMQRKYYGSVEINNTYNSTLEDIQELFKKNNKLHRRDALLKYIEEEDLTERLCSHFARGTSRKKQVSSKDFFRFIQDASCETIKNKVVDELLKQRKPSEIAWSITGAILGAGTRTLKNLLQTKS
ncbi:MAG: hypothetical protein ACREOW_10520 [Thermodesulfobacteriota bacterium]